MKQFELVKLIFPITALAIGYYFQWQANRLKRKRWYAENSYKLGRLYKQIDRYESIAKIIYISAVIISCASFLY